MELLFNMTSFYCQFRLIVISMKILQNRSYYRSYRRIDKSAYYYKIANKTSEGNEVFITIILLKFFCYLILFFLIYSYVFYVTFF